MIVPRRVAARLPEPWRPWDGHAAQPPIVALVLHWFADPSRHRHCCADIHPGDRHRGRVAAAFPQRCRAAGLGAPVASIGGAGTFDGIFLTGILAVLLAGLYRPRRRRGSTLGPIRRLKARSGERDIEINDITACQSAPSPATCTLLDSGVPFALLFMRRHDALPARLRR
jgi:Protein of unknown function (DUF1614)